jgi:hypothetical protein
MDTRQTSATVRGQAVPRATETIDVSDTADISVVRAREPDELVIPNATALSAINRTITRLTQQMMEHVSQHPESVTVAKGEALLAEARRQLASIRRRSSANPRVRAGLHGAHTALQTAAREVREHLIRHGWTDHETRPKS